MKNLHKYVYPQSFILESGESLDKLEITYHTIGTFRKDSKVVWVCHALTANSDVSDWWSGLFGAGNYFDKEEYFVVCANVLGSCYGTTGPLSKRNDEELYYLDFPKITPRDMANAHEVLRQELKINEIDLLIGSSLGGQQAQEFAYILKENLNNLILIATNPFHSPFGIAFNEAQRLALLADPTFLACVDGGGEAGLVAARSFAMLSYRSYDGYLKTQRETDAHKTDDFKASSYQRYQGEKLANRFNAYSYWYLSKAMDAHNIGRNRISVQKALQEIRAGTLVIGINSDILFPVSEQQFLADAIPNAKLEIIDSIFGHDGFLVETELLEQLIDEFLKK
ncbi:MAG: homoserine O-acetyltransferase [Flavobacteriia bacterium]|jgi:homoserine O-acetyltransferase